MLMRSAHLLLPHSPECVEGKNSEVHFQGPDVLTRICIQADLRTITAS
jgi:hypothetical protein